ncbi:uncharacterized protein ColSpa_02869 [Colletotrichum spaethianum]|uniref:Uncharacterized protein n=1 Tax=Colletotrichum spaethianum TaxID=700344 RepID=A0AA37L6C0_9PEZI|nr:uncharacterized protein ColSpa_02869 [Colletotrichum spaethianum]GKT42688.1 hypothetical protein ColSpa_02869 [Colletotrichum spaethianum]
MEMFDSRDYACLVEISPRKEEDGVKSRRTTRTGGKMEDKVVERQAVKQALGYAEEGDENEG